MRWKWMSAAVPVAALFAYGQTARPAFDVASVRLNTHCDTMGASRGRSMPGRIALECADLRDLILTAYGIYGNGANPAPGSFRMQVEGGPAWMDSTRYDIAATPVGNPPRSQMYGPMLQSLLEDRFKLRVHRETREGPVYLLTVAKNGPKLTATKEGACIISDIDHPPELANAATPVCGKSKVSSAGDAAAIDAPGATIANLCSWLGMVLDREVIDKTGIAGRFDLHLEVTPADLQPKFVAGRTIEQQPRPAPENADTGPSIFTALQKQLGLKLQGAKGPVQILIVDHIERPTDN